MILELIIALAVGICIGTITGLTPGIHINLVAAGLLASSPFLLALFQPISLVIFIVSVAITHTFVDYIPSIFLGAPDDTNYLSVLPGHRLLLQGKGYFAIIFTLYGGLTALGLLLISTPVFIFILPKIYPYILRIMWIILILFSAYLVLKEKEKKILALFIFLLSGFLGIAALNLNLKEPLLPLFSGLFGASTLIVSISKKTKIPEQSIAKLREIKINKKHFLENSLISILVSPLTALLPTIGSSQAALIGTELKEQSDERDFLFLVGGINILAMALSFITFYSIQKTRTGAAVAFSKLISEPTFSNLLLIILTIIISGILAFTISINLSKIISKNIHKFNYSKISILIISILTIFVILFSGFLGLLVFVISTTLGISAIKFGVKRTQLMGCLLIPTILFYLF